MAELKNIFVLTNKIEDKNFSAIHEKKDYWLFVIFHSSILYSYDAINYYPMAKNTVVLYSPNQIQAYKSNDSFFLNSFVIFNTDKSYFDEFKFPLNEPFTLQEKYIKQITTTLDGVSFIKNTNFFPEQKIHIPSILKEVFNMVERGYAEIQIDNSNANLLFSLKEDILYDPINNNVKKISDKSGYCESYFCKIYKEQFGISPGKERQLQIIKIIKKYLETTNYTLETIAELCGISSLPFMIKIFKREEKLTPHQYRMAIQKRKDYIHK